MNILWIEDFGGLQAGKNILNQMFGDLLSFNAWDNDLFSLKTKPSDLNEFCTQQKSLHTIYLCRNYFDYAEFKENHAILNEIDAIIIDVRLDNGEHVDLDKEIPESYTDKSKFHENGGFYIFNDLIHLGVPAEKMCFMTAETSTVKGFENKCTEIYMPKVTVFEKIDADYIKLRNWITEKESSYTKLRRGIIEACQDLKKLKEKLRFSEFNADEKKPVFLNVDDYLDTLENFLPLREPTNKAALYKLFIRTLAHEWEESVKPKKLNGDQTTFAFSWIMKMTRNWIAHNSTAIFNKLTEQDVAYLFICNMRAIFDLGNKLERYEERLFFLFNKNKQSEAFKKSELNVREKRIPLVKNYVSYFNETDTNAIHVHNILNDLQNDKVRLKEKGDDFFVTGLYQSFWFLTSRCTNKNDKAKENMNNPNQVFISRHYSFEFFDYTQSDFLLKFASHIYNRSFS